MFCHDREIATNKCMSVGKRNWYHLLEHTCNGPLFVGIICLCVEILHENHEKPCAVAIYKDTD